MFDAAGNTATPDANTAVQYVSKYPGAAGNGFTVEYIVGAGSSEAITVLTTGSLVTGVQVTTRAGGSTPSQIAAIVTASTAAGAVTATAVLPGSTTKINANVGPIPLLGGTSNVTLTVTYSEVVRQNGTYGSPFAAGPPAVNHVAWAGSAFVTSAILDTPATTPSVDGTSNVYTITLTGVTVRPGAGAQFTNGGSTDLAGNPLAPVTVTMTAVS